VVVEAEANNARKTTLWSGRGIVLKKSLTEPTLLEMSGFATTQELRAVLWEKECSTTEVPLGRSKYQRTEGAKEEARNTSRELHDRQPE
jgi:hypothetical protein